MNNNERVLIQHICDGDMKKAQMKAKCILTAITSQRDAAFRDDMLRRLEAKKGFIELPQNLKSLLMVEDSALFPEAKFFTRKTEAEAAKKTMSLYRAAERLANLGISYLPALILYGESGCGKTELARYIAYKAELPFAYVRFSNVLDSHLGGTQSNIARIFEYIRSNPCVLCFDEIDAIGMMRGQEHDVGEMSRVVIAVMQELDRATNNSIIIGTTNRFDRIDPALARRFPLQYELFPLSGSEAKEFAQRFFKYAGLPLDKEISRWCDDNFDKNFSAATIVKKCTEAIVDYVLEVET